MSFPSEKPDTVREVFSILAAIYGLSTQSQNFAGNLKITAAIREKTAKRTARILSRGSFSTGFEIGTREDDALLTFPPDSRRYPNLACQSWPLKQYLRLNSDATAF